MEAKSNIKLLSLAPYRPLFPAATAVDHTVKKGANVSDTVSFIPQVVKETAWQVESFVNQELRGLPLYNACEKLWHFVKHHIKYEKDERGSEQVRSPRRLIHDAKGDCDCFTTFIDTCLYSLGVKGIINRITKYKQDHFQHIYPIIPDGKRGYIIMDCVVDKFNYEEPYSEKKDYIMDLQFLDGIDENERLNQRNNSQGEYEYSDLLGDLGKLLKKRNAEKAAKSPALQNRKPILKKPLFHKKQSSANAAPKNKASRGAKTLRTVNKVNKVNPATILLRAGILASMKLNVLKVAERLKWGYASPELAQSKGMDMSKYEKLKNLLAKTEKIFYGAGGQPENLKKAILTGHGNRNKEVAGINDDTELSELLGEIYASEFISGMDGFEGFGELGEPATAASIAAASTTMGSLAALLKVIGDLFPKKKNSPTKQGASQGDEADQEESENQVEVESENTDAGSDETQEINEEDSSSPSESSDEDMEETPVEEFSEDTTEGILSGTTKGLKAFWQKNKSWLLPVGISALAITGILIYSATQSSTPTKPKKQNALNGWSKSKRSSKKRGKQTQPKG